MRIPKKYDSTDVQGPDSYVIMWRRTHKQAKQQRDGDLTGDDALEKMLREAVVEWNWTDSDGDPLPLPKDDATVLDDMPENELSFLLRVFLGAIDVKN